MNRLTPPLLAVPRWQKLLNWIPQEPQPPTAPEMLAFALQFSRQEWVQLCDDRAFRSLIDKDLKEAGVIATSLLKRSVFVGSH